MNEESDPLSSSHTSGSVKKRVRKLQLRWTKRQTEQLISLVKKREGLWNYVCKEYRERAVRDTLWQDVADEMRLPRSEVTNKWNSLRCSFRATFNRMGISLKSGRNWTAPNSIYTALKFMEPSIRCDVTTTSENTLNLIEYPIKDMFEVDVEGVKIENNLLSRSPSPAYSNSSPAPSPSPPPSNPISPSPSSPVPPLSPPVLSRPKVAIKRRHMENVDTDYANVIECALQSFKSNTKSDAWDDLGSFVASNGREWAVENPQMAKEFKIAINEVVLNFQKKSAWSQ